MTPFLVPNSVTLSDYHFRVNVVRLSSVNQVSENGTYPFPNDVQHFEDFVFDILDGVDDESG